MEKKITCIYKGKRLYDDGTDNQAPPYKVHDFIKIKDEQNNPLPGCFFKDTKLFRKIPFVERKKYEITIEDYQPIEISFDGEKYYRKNGNSIMHIDNKGNKTNLSYSPVTQSLGKAKRAYTLKQKRAYNSF